MKAILICNKGIEDIASIEVKEIIGAKAEIKDSHITFNIKTKEELCKLCYCCRSIQKALLVIDELDFSSENEIMDKISSLNLTEWIKDKSFAAEAETIDSELNVEELRGKIGKAVIDSFKETPPRVNLKNPDIVFFVLIHKTHAYLGIDLSGEDLSKRIYRIFIGPRDIKATIAYSMIRVANYQKNSVLLDPFCLSGSIAIEASLYNNSFSPWFFEKEKFLFRKFIEFDFDSVDALSSKDKGTMHCIDSMFKNVDAAKKNAKIAGINKAIDFSRMTIDWLDTKFDKDTIDYIVTVPPDISKHVNEKEMVKLYVELFYQAEFILKKSGCVVLITRNTKQFIDAAKEKGFSCTEQKQVWQGKEMLNILKFEKN